MNATIRVRPSTISQPVRKRSADLVAEGKDNRDDPHRELFISPYTVKNHILRHPA